MGRIYIVLSYRLLIFDAALKDIINFFYHLKGHGCIIIYDSYLPNKTDSIRAINLNDIRSKIRNFPVCTREEFGETWEILGQMENRCFSDTSLSYKQLYRC